ncbi:MAG: AAA family ATPase [Eubacteriaceae bacterium]|nr:AAA family ATPase [Eubacteriaceae bacterium]
MTIISKEFQVTHSEDIARIYGKYDENITTIEQQLGVEIDSGDGFLSIKGEEEAVEKSLNVLQEILKIISKKGVVTKDKTEYIISLSQKGKEERYQSLDSTVICYTVKGKPIKPKTLGQQRYIQAIKNNDVIFGIGPAGTGKTYLAMAMAITAFKNGEVDRLILTRPAVEAGEKLGFLPGDLQDKVDPYLRPLYDALFEIMGSDTFQRNLDKGLIEVAPLAYMRGRTLERAYIILDEAQNTTPEQMKMFLTRFGSGSKVIVTGDITQIDLPYGKQSGLKQVMGILKNIEGITFTYFDKSDVVRHRLVEQIIDAYDKFDKFRKKKDQEMEKAKEHEEK